LEKVAKEENRQISEELVRELEQLDQAYKVVKPKFATF
jgi:hypothetical protein